VGGTGGGDTIPSNIQRANSCIFIPRLPAPRLASASDQGRFHDLEKLSWECSDKTF